MTRTSIEWATDSWNPVAAFDKETGKRGWFCTKVSPGCTNCYAEKWNQFRGNGHLYRVGNLNKVRFELAPNFTAPLRWRKSRRVFVNSMTDLFLEAHTDEMIDQVVGVIATLRAWAMPHEFLVLTKRPERQRDYFNDPATRERIARIAAQNTDDANADNVWSGLMSEWWPLSNLWLGTSTENQDEADLRIPLLLDTQAFVRFISCEPLLGPLAFPLPSKGSRFWSSLHWVIVGGESGSKARPCSPLWIRSIVQQCQRAKVACFVKQFGSAPLVTLGGKEFIGKLLDRKGGDPSEWAEDLRIREFPKAAP